MQWKFWHISGPRRVPEKVREELASRFHLKPAEIDGLRLVEKWGHLAALTGVIAEDRRVRLILVFDPACIEKERLITLTYDDLKTPAWRKAMVFEGHIERDGLVHLADRRPPRTTLGPINLDPHSRAATAPTQ